jgi:hypothetical protein
MPHPQPHAPPSAACPTLSRMPQPPARGGPGSGRLPPYSPAVIPATPTTAVIGCIYCFRTTEVSAEHLSYAEHPGAYCPQKFPHSPEFPRSFNTTEASEAGGASASGQRSSQLRYRGRPAVPPQLRPPRPRVGRQASVASTADRRCRRSCARQGLGPAARPRLPTRSPRSAAGPEWPLPAACPRWPGALRAQRSRRQ